MYFRYLFTGGLIFSTLHNSENSDVVVLPDVNSETNISLKEYKGKIGTVIMSICNHCTYVKHVNPTLTKISK